MFLRLLLATCFCLATTSLQAADTAVKFVNDWKWEGQAAPLLLALDNGYFKEELLDVTLDTGNGSVDALPKVAAGDYDLGSADINSLITWRENNPGVDLKAIYIIYSAPPFAILSRPSLGVTGPLDLEGHTLGAPALDGAFAQWPAFAAANGIFDSRVTIEDVSFPERAPKLVAGEVDAITGFSFSVYIDLLQSGVPASDISLMLMSDFGLDLYGNAIIVNPDFAREHPGTVRAFLRAAVRGYQDTISNPVAALEHVLSRNDDADKEAELKRLIMAIGHHIVTDEVRSIGLGDVVESRLDKSIAQLNAIYNFATVPEASDIFDNSYLPSRALRELPDTSQATAAPAQADADENKP